MDKETNRQAREAADWVVRVMNEAEALPMATNLYIAEEAYHAYMSGYPRREILTNMCNQIFLVSVIPMRGTREEVDFRQIAGLGATS